MWTQHNKEVGEQNLFLLPKGKVLPYFTCDLIQFRLTKAHWCHTQHVMLAKVLGCINEEYNGFFSQRTHSLTKSWQMTYDIRIHIHICMLLLRRFSSVQLCATPQTAAHQAPVPGILKARTLEWVAISFSNIIKPRYNENILLNVNYSKTCLY